MSDVDAINTLRNAFLAAFNSGDIQAMASHLTDDTVGMPPKKVPLAGLEANKADWAEGFSQGTSVFAATPVEVEVAGDWAFDRFEWSMTFTPAAGGDSAVDGGNCVWIDRRQPDGSWKIWRSIWNSTRGESGPWG